MPSFRLLPIQEILRRSFAPAAAALLAPGFAWAGPSGGQVVGGAATIANPASNGTVINQSSNSAVINWQQFNIGSGEYVQFVQPNSSSVALNRVVGGSPSEILGSLSANGRVFLVNPLGVAFARGATVDVAGLVASTLDIKNEDFMAGRYVFVGSGASGASVTNAGILTAHDGGFVILGGDRVANTGLIQARLGQVVLASGSAMTLDLNGDGLISFAVDKATLADNAGVANAGQILADGGQVLMTAATARALTATAVNNSGLVRAQGIAEHDGRIELVAGGGDITNSGTLDASAAADGAGGAVALASDRDIRLTSTSRIAADGSPQSAGGSVRVIADGDANLDAGSAISATGGAGGGFAELSGHHSLHLRGDVHLGAGGTLLLDPTDLTVAAGSPGTSSSATVYQQTIEDQLAGNTNVVLAATHKITVDALDNGSLTSTGLGDLTIGIGSAAGGSSVRAFAAVKFTPTKVLPSGSFVRGSGFTDDGGSSGGIFFSDRSNSINIAGNLSLIGGSSVGVIDVGHLSGRNVDVLGHGDVSTGNLTATQGSVTVTSEAGSINVVGNVNVTGAGGGGVDSASFSAAGAVNTGAITVNNPGGGAALYISGDDIHVAGDVLVHGGGGTASSDSSIRTAALASFDANRETLIDGSTTLIGDATSQSSTRTIDGEGGTHELTTTIARGDAELYVGAEDVTLGAVTVSGVGNAEVDIEAPNRITLNGPVQAIATRSSVVRSSTGGHTEDDSGFASITVSAGPSSSDGGSDTSHIEANGLSATGPNAIIDVSAATMELHGAPSLGGRAVVAQAIVDGDGLHTSSAYYSSTSSGAKVVESDFGYAGVTLTARNAGFYNGPSQNSFDGDGILSGGISVDGPAAVAHLAAAGPITINGDVSVAGHGYFVNGESSRLPAFESFSSFLPIDSIVIGNSNGSAPFETQPPVLFDDCSSVNCTTTWGPAVLELDGLASGNGINGNPNTGTGPVTVGGAIAVQGVGAAQLDIQATGLSVGTMGSTAANNGAVSVTATNGLLQGVVHTGGHVGSSSYQVARSISDGAGGAARYGHAESMVFLSGSSGDATMNSFTVRAPGATAYFDGGNNLSIAGAALVEGGFDGTPVYQEDAHFTPIFPNGNSFDATTRVVGDATGLLLGRSNAVNGTYSAASTTVVGDGLVAMAIIAGGVDAGAVSLTQHAGSYTTDDPTRSGAPIDLSDPSAALLLSSTGDGNRAQAQSITANAVGPLALGVDADVAGAASFTAESFTESFPGAEAEFLHPLRAKLPDSESSPPPPPDPLPTSGLSLDAGSIALVATGSSINLDDFTLASTGPLSARSLTGDVSSSDFSNAGGLDLRAAQAITVGHLSSTTGGIRLQGASVTSTELDAAQALTVVSAGGFANGGADLRGTDIALTAASFNIPGAHLKAPGAGLVNTISITQTAGNLNLADFSLASSGLLSVNATVGNLSSVGFSNPGAIAFHAGQTLTLANLASVNGGITLSGAQIGAGSLHAAQAVSANSGGNLSTGNITTPGTIDLTAGGTLIAGDLDPSDVNATSGGDMTLGNITATGNVILDAGGALGAGNIEGVALSADSVGAMTLGTLTASGDITLNSGATLAAGIVQGASLASTSSSDTTLADVTITGAVTLEAGGALQAHDLVASGLSATTGSGGQTFNDLTLGAGGYQFAVGDVAGQKVTVHDIHADGDGSLHFVNASFTAHDIDGAGGLNATLDNGNLGLGSVTSGHDIALDVNHGTLSFGALAAQNIALTLGHALSLSHASLDATHALTLDSTGAFNDSGSQLRGATVSLTAASFSFNGTAIGGHGGALADTLSLTATTGDLNATSLSLASSGLLKLDAQAGNLMAGDLANPGSIDLHAAHHLGTGALTSANGGITLAGGDIVTGDLMAAADISGTSVGDLTLGKVTTPGAVSLDAGGAVHAGDIDPGSVSVTSGGDMKLGSITADGMVTLDAGGNLAAADITAAGLSTTIGSGDESLHDLNLGPGGYQFHVGDVSGQQLIVHDIHSDNDSTLSFSNASFTAHDISGAGSLSLALANGNLNLDKIAVDGDASLNVGNGTLAFTSLSAHNLSLVLGQSLLLNGATLDAVDALTVTGTGDFTDTGSQLSGNTIAVSAANLGLTGTTIGGHGGGSAATIELTSSANLSLSQATIAGDAIHLDAGGDLAIDGGQISTAAPLSAQSSTKAVGPAGRLQLDAGGAIHLADGASLAGEQVAMTAVGAIDSAGADSTIDAGALSVKAQSIDLTHAALTIGNGLADFGADPDVLQRLGAVAPDLVPISSGPNASFSAPGGIALGSISFQAPGGAKAGGNADFYLFLNGPSASLPDLSAPADVFVHYLPTDPAAVLSLNPLQPPSGGVVTVLYGGTAETGNIQIGDGLSHISIPDGTNFVFASAGTTRFPNAISTSGRVIVLGDSIELQHEGLDGIPLDDTQFRPELEGAGPQGPSGGELIEIRSAGDLPESCAVGGGS